MNFLGYDLFGTGSDASPCAGNPSLAGFVIQNGIYDGVYLSGSPDEFSTFYDSGMKWTEDTLLFADFNQKTLGGSNFEYGSDLHEIKLKRREIGADQKPWVLLYEQLAGHGNINFVYNDYFARGRETEYEYALVPVLSDGTELPYIKTTVQSKFYGAIITDGTVSYHILLDPSITETDRNRQSSVVTTLNRKYPFVFFGGKSNYTSGSFSGTAIRYLKNDTFDVAHSHWYREDMIDWLTNGGTKILKIEDGRIWMVAIDGNVKSSNSEHPDKVTLSFDFTEVGSVNDDNDMLNNGFVNVMTGRTGEETYNITNNFYYVDSDNTDTTISEGKPYTATLSPVEDYEISGVVVFMGGLNVTNTTYVKRTDESTGKVSHEINIPSVYGNVTIIASATRVRIIAQSFSLTESKFTISVGNNHKLEYTTYPSGASQNVVIWKSADTKIATVTDKGVVEGVSPGSTTITATMDNLIATCSVVVTTS